MYPPHSYLQQPRVSSIVNVYGPFTFTCFGSQPLSSAIPFTSVNVTKSPSSRPWRPSSSTVTSPSSSCEIDDTIAESGSSPLVSYTVNASPKSQKTAPKTPKVSVMMKRAPAPRHASLIATASASGTPVSTTIPNDAHSAGVSASVERATGVYWLSSASRGAVTSARGFPTSASVRKNCAERSESATGASSCSVTDLTPASTTFFAISTPRPLRPTISTVAPAMRRIASWPRT